MLDDKPVESERQACLACMSIGPKCVGASAGWGPADSDDNSDHPSAGGRQQQCGRQGGVQPGRVLRAEGAGAGGYQRRQAVGGTSHRHLRHRPTHHPGPGACSQALLLQPGNDIIMLEMLEHRLFASGLL